MPDCLWDVTTGEKITGVSEKRANRGGGLLIS
jgi:hypothetical protein